MNPVRNNVDNNSNKYSIVINKIAEVVHDSNRANDIIGVANNRSCNISNDSSSSIHNNKDDNGLADNSKDLDEFTCSYRKKEDYKHRDNNILAGVVKLIGVDSTSSPLANTKGNNTEDARREDHNAYSVSHSRELLYFSQKLAYYYARVVDYSRSINRNIGVVDKED